MSIVLNPLGTYQTGVFDEGAQEINAYDPETQRLFVVNADATTIDVLDLGDPANPIKLGSLDASAFGSSANSVAVKEGLIAVAIEAPVSTDPGKVVFFNADETDFANPTLVAEVGVGALPDMVAFTPDGSTLVVANEGEPDGGVDPDGSVSLIDIDTFTEQKATFDAFNAQQAELQAAGLRLFPGKTLSADVEPEYVAITSDGAQAYVSLQEANAVAVVDINTATVTDIQPLQPIDHSQPGNGLDPSDRDSGINIQTWPVLGLQMPDALAVHEVGGETYYVTANEGDDRGDADADATGDAVRLKDLDEVTSFGRTGLGLDASITDVYPNIADDDQLGRLTISTVDGDTDGDGDIDQIHAYGSRSFSIFDSQGNLVFNSGDDFERITAQAFPDDFNANNDENDSFESRSDNKGPEPEGVTLGEIDGQTYAFVGLERVGGIMVYDITGPANASFVSYINNRDFSVDAELADGSTNTAVGNLGPEGLTFIAAEESPNGQPLLAVSNEVSGTTTVYEIESPAAAASDLVISGVIDGPLSGGVPKAIELYAVNDIADLSSYGLGGANNGGGSDGEELNLSGSVNAGEYLYIASESTGFEDFFGFAPDFTSNAASINGDDAIELFKDGEVVDLFGDIDVDGTGQPWEYLDGWAYRKAGTGPDGNTFELSNWTFSGPNALDGESSNDAAANPFPVGSFAADSGEEGAYTLELLHAADQEAGSAAIQDAPRFSAVLNALRAQDLGGDGLPENTLTLSAGDAFIPGLFFDASEAAFGSAGIADIQIQNELGFQAISFGNHEFDFGTATLAGLIDGSAAGDFSALTGTDLDGQDFTGAAFPYLSTNLDFATDANLDPLQVAGGQAPQAGVVTSSTVIDVNGENIGVVGATTPTLDSISSPGDLGIAPADFDGNPTPAQLDALAAEIQTEVDALLAANPDMNKVVLLAHMQKLDIELALAERLSHVDIIVAGGSNTRLFDDNDRIRAGDSDQGQYPQFVTDADGVTTAVVNTDGSYKYVGRLVIDFDSDGHIIANSYDPEVSGAYATDAQGVADLNAEGLIDPEIQAIADAIEAQVVATESNVFGVSEVFLNGNRSGVETPEETDGVRTQETNLGNLTADANLSIAREFDDSVVVSIKNGGGIRASIGETIVPPGGTEPVRSPNEAVIDSDGNIVKPEGGISQNDIQTTLAFNNGLTLLTLTKAELVAVLEHGISAIPGVDGRFPQVSGVKFSYDSDLPAGDRINSAGIFDENDDLIAELVRDGELVGDASQTFRVVTLNFLAGGGDDYPFPSGPEANRVDLTDLDGDGNADGDQTGDATFADDGTEQDALAEYLDDNFNPDNGGEAFGATDTGRNLDERIQNLNFRTDTVLEPEAAAPELIISEIWPGQAGSDLTEDWFEITNVGDVVWDDAAFGDLFYDDESQDPTDATKIENIVSIAPGESAIVVVGDSADAAGWETVWGDDIDLTNLQVGWTDGSGLSNGGDAVTLFLRDEPVIGQAPNDGLDADDIIDVATYPDADGNSGRAWEVAAGQFATLEDFEDTVATMLTAGDSGEEPAIASPGFIPTEGERVEHTLISAIQGAGFVSPLIDQTVSVNAVVTLVSDQLNGFFLQEEDADADGDDATSEGIFVYTGSDPSVEVGNRVSFSATVDEFFDATQLSGLQDLVVEAESVALPTPASVSLPLADVTDPAAFFESIEGMQVTVTAGEGEALTVTDTYTRFGEVGVTSGDPLMQPTQVHASFSPAAEALAEANARDYLLFENAEDDSLSSAPRVGDGIVDNEINGVMHYTFGDYKVETQGAVDFDPSVNPYPRQDAPEAIEGRLKVASFNVLNYFTTLTSEDSDARGASTAQELADQTAKIVAAISAIDADILGLMEIENDLGDVDDEAVAALVNALNAELGAGTYDYIATGKVGGDAIKQAVIYKPEAVTPIGDSAVLDSEAFIDPLGAGRDLNRPALAQSFEENGTGEVFTVSVNHLKSKGSPTGVVVDGEPDDTDVEGSAALTRIAAAEELADWLATDPTGSGDPDQLTIGDFNAYAMERAIQALDADGFSNLADADSISYQFDGRLGTLDYAFANESLLDQIQDYTIWNVNSLEAHAQQYSAFQFDALGDSTSPFGSSDHDPVIVGLNLQAPAPERLLVEGTSGRDYLVGSDEAEIIAGRGGFGDLLVGGGDEDIFSFDTIGDGARDYARVMDFEAGIDSIQLASDDYDVLLTSRYARITAGEENDLILIGGSFESIDALGINVGSIDGLIA